jgi:hypothetical protein
LSFHSLPFHSFCLSFSAFSLSAFSFSLSFHSLCLFILFVFSFSAFSFSLSFHCLCFLSFLSSGKHLAWDIVSFVFPHFWHFLHLLVQCNCPFELCKYCLVFKCAK